MCTVLTFCCSFVGQFIKISSRLTNLADRTEEKRTMLTPTLNHGSYFINLFNLVCPRSSGERKGLRHMTLDLFSLEMFSLADKVKGA